MPPGPCDLVAQSMGGVVAALIALEHADRVRRLVLCTTSGGVDVASLGATDWRPGYRAEMSHVPDWFVVDRTDITARLPTLRAPTLVLYGDQDPLCPEGVAGFLASRIPGAQLDLHPRRRSHAGEQPRRRGRAADPRAPRVTTDRSRSHGRVEGLNQSEPRNRQTPAPVGSSMLLTRRRRECRAVGSTATRRAGPRARCPRRRRAPRCTAASAGAGSRDASSRLRCAGRR